MKFKLVGYNGHLKLEEKCILRLYWSKPAVLNSDIGGKQSYSNLASTHLPVLSSEHEA